MKRQMPTTASWLSASPQPHAKRWHQIMNRSMILKDEIRVRRQHCCRVMTSQANLTCSDHPDIFDCPDLVVYYSSAFDEYGVPVPKSRETTLIDFCPFCGHALSPSQRDNWFRKLKADGIDPWKHPIPKEFLSDKWRRNQMPTTAPTLRRVPRRK